MTGDDRQRHCRRCNLNVYNLSEMSRNEAEAFLAECEGRVCVKLYRRHDGTVITKDCPVGLAAVRAQVVRIALATVGLLLGFTATALTALGKVPGLGPYINNGRVGQLHMQHSPMWTMGAVFTPMIDLIEPEPWDEGKGEKSAGEETLQIPLDD